MKWFSGNVLEGRGYYTEGNWLRCLNCFDLG